MDYSYRQGATDEASLASSSVAERAWQSDEMLGNSTAGPLAVCSGASRAALRAVAWAGKWAAPRAELWGDARVAARVE